MCKMCEDGICTNRCVPPSKREKTVADVARDFLATNPTQEQKDIFFEALQLIRETNRNAMEAVQDTNRALDLCEQAINQTDSAMNQTEVVMAVVDKAMTKPSMH